MSATPSIEYFDKLFDGVLSRSAAAKDAAPRLSYYGSFVPGKDSWVEKQEGYRVYLNVPIARTGSQNYLGRELKKNPGYLQDWNIGDDEVVTVYRPIEEVTAPETLASFEGMSVLDEHPPDPQVLIDAVDEYDGITKGHAQNIRAGETLADGETSIVADLHVKHPELNMKVDGGIRDVSCGYRFLLGKDSEGRYVQTRIRGNHVAIVPVGRAGREVGIKDSDPEQNLRRHIMPRTLRQRFQALGFQNWVKDAKPDEVADALEELGSAKDADAEEEKVEKEMASKAAKDKAAKDAKRGAKDAPEHPKGCMCDAKDCMEARSAKDEDEFGDDEMTDAEGEEKEEKEEKEKAAKDKKGGKDEDALILPADEHSRSEFSVSDAAKSLNILRPLVARSKDKGVKDAYRSLKNGFEKVQSGVKDGVPDPFVAMTRISPEGGANDGEPDIPMFMFFNGKKYEDGLKDWNQYQETRYKK